MSLLKNLDPALLNKFLPAGTAPPDPAPVNAAITAEPEIKKKKRVKHGVHLSFADFLKDDSGWLYEKVDALINKMEICQRITVMLQRQLWDYGHAFVIKGFTYQNSEMDIMSIVNDQVNEFEVKTCRLDYLNDFNKKVFMGKPISKHGLLKAGKFVTNHFWYVCPAGIIDVEHLPPYAGLMIFNAAPIGEKQFTVIKEAPLLHSNRVAPGFYKTLATRLYDRYENMAKRYQHSSIINNLRYVKPERKSETDILPTEHNPANPDSVNAEG